VRMLDAPGHPTDPAARRAGLPAPQDKVQPIVIGDNVWIGAYATICPGVVIGDGCVVGTASVVTKSVPPYTVVAGNPARPIRNLTVEPESLPLVRT
jgi:maltose O-acetyltransferase